MSIVLILTVCAPLAGGVEDCNDYIVDAWQGANALTECAIVMDANRQRLDDRYLSCGSVNVELLRDRRDNRTPAEILADLNAQITYTGRAAQ